ncbi:LysR substrate-binding domain-containing protein [Piscinibacter sp. XHJ-5]|uniref:LysR substrate-binding domain-containing protein n=1 Tax=Piscinibacter sp. XHJ-5 TaxID=3037797 RepID=UPI002452924A|nr:LysR substrate-binding domain-containing protein [Piscinibacter sp. XHJ-5]
MQAAKASDFKIDIAADLHKWRAFVAIGELGSLTRAALFLDSNQSLLSRQLNALERECGARLFNRTGRGVELSETGTRLFPQVKALLADAERLESEIRGEAREPSGRVTLGLLPSISLPLVGRLYVETSKRYPAVSLKVLEGSSGQVEEWLADARVDIAILYRYGPLPEMEQSLAVVDSYLIGPPGDKPTAVAEVAFDRLNELPFILPSAPNGLRTALDAIARQRRITLAPVIEADSLPLQKGLVATERLYTVLPIHAVWSEVADKRLQAARIFDPPFQRTISMATSKSKGPARAVSAVGALIVEIVEDMAGAGMWRPSDAP